MDYRRLITGQRDQKMRWETAKVSHIGSRPEQQDRVDVLVSPDDKACLAMVADGLGGHGGGALAAQALIDAAKVIWQRADLSKLRSNELFLAIFSESYRSITRIAEEKGISPRTTCVLLYVDDCFARWAHLGDSRLYRFRNGQLLGRTRDHSVVQMLVDMNKIREEEMTMHPDQNMLLKTLGGDKTPNPDFGETKLQPGDAFLLCSDGFWTVSRPQEMAEALTALSLERAAHFLVQRAVQRGGQRGDNIAVAMVRSKV